MRDAVERRSGHRLAARTTRWPETAILRPGQEVTVVNLSHGGVLLESSTRMAPGARAELQLLGIHRRMVRGRIDRCHVARLEPLRYRGAVVFDEHLELDV